MKLVAGRHLTDNLRLLRKLGEGGMGSVWVAEHHALSTEVVVKFMSPEIANEPSSVARFAREAALAAKVRHPHVVQVFDHGVTSGGLPYIVMELLEGRTLADELRARGLLLGEVSSVVLQAAKALERVHELGCVHRDIKPENIFLCPIGHHELFVKILDFGIAKPQTDGVSSLTSTNVIMGTPHYMSPELIVSARHVDRHADLWALAVVAFEALTGALPFRGDTVAAITLELHAEKRPRVRERVPELPPELDAWFDRAFAKSPTERFPDARTMARELCAILPPVGSSLQPEPPPSQPVVTPQPPRRRGRFIALGTATIALMVIGQLVGDRERSAAAENKPVEASPPSASAPPAALVPSAPATIESVTAPVLSTTTPAPAKTAPPIVSVKASKLVPKHNPTVPKTFDDIE